MWISFVYLILLSCSITLGEEYFDCRRQGQDCANNKTCQNDGTCDCGNDYTGYNCELKKSLSGSSPCTNQTDSCGSDGGICYNDNGNKACFCPPGFYGDHCENKRYEVTCEKSSMLIVINPAGTFSGVVYVKGGKYTIGCKFTKSDLPSGKQGVALNVQDSDCGGVTPLNGGRSRDVIIQFSDKYMTNFDSEVHVICEENDGATIVKVTKVITSKHLERKRQNITNTFNSIDSSLVQFNINLKDGSPVSESAAVSLDEELTFEFITNFTAEIQLYNIADIEPVNVRLVGGNTSKEGRVEVLHDGKWGRLFTKQLYFYEATTVCRNLGFNNAFGLPRGKGFFPGGSGQIWTGDLDCHGYEMDVDDCNVWKIKGCEDKCGQQIGVICDESPTPYTLRLVDQGSKQEGKLQIYDEGKWNSVCYKNHFDRASAEVACRQLGYTKVEHFAIGEQVVGNRWKYDAKCLDYEPGLHLCVLIDHDEQTDCHYVKLNCSVDISNIELRLVGGPSSNYGVVEIKINNEWGRLYDDLPSPGDAKVLCKTLGFNHYRAMSFSESEHNMKSSNKNIWTSRVRCSGLEKNINECYLQLHEKDDHEKYTALLCAEDNPEIEIRLVGGSSEREGRVEIKYLGMWGTVCDDFHTDYNAAVYCRMLGFPNSNATAVNEAYFGAGSGPIVLQHVHCLGNETSFEQCSFHWDDYWCSHGEDAGVICAEPANSGTLRLESCTADNQKTGEDRETLKIIEDSCPSSEIGKLMIQEPERSGNNVTFKLKAFTFNKNNAVSTECSVKVCPPDQKSQCDPVDCNGKEGFGRKRRSAVASDELVRKTYIVLDEMNRNQIPSISQKPAEKQGSDQVNVSTTILIVLCVVVVMIFSLVIGIVVNVFLKKKKSSLKKEDFNKQQI